LIVIQNNTRNVYDFCFIDARTILLAISVSRGGAYLQAIFFPFDGDDATGVSLDVPSVKIGNYHRSLEFKTDYGALIGIRVGIEDTTYRDPDKSYLLVIDRPGLLKFLAGAKLAGGVQRRLHQWAEWGSEITTILPLGINPYWMQWAVLGRRIVIDADAETLPFTESAVKVADENEAEDDGHQDDEDQGSEDHEGPDNRERLIVVDFGCHRLASVVEAGDASGNIIRFRTQSRGLLRGIVEFPSKELPYRIWMERVPSRLPNRQVHMSESMVLVVDVSC